jgi:hypothetical protein
MRSRPRRSNWQPHHAQRPPLEPDPLPRFWSRLSLGLATLLTALLFALTSATPPPLPLPPPQVTMVDAPPAEMPPPACNPANDACSPGKPPPR